LEVELGMLSGLAVGVLNPHWRCDICLKNKITFEDAISIIGFSYLHFDSESGPSLIYRYRGSSSFKYFEYGVALQNGF